MGDNILVDVKTALAKSGYTDEQISRMITADAPVPVSRMKAIANTLSRERIYGFERDQNFAIQKYLDKEKVKRQNIARIKQEHILEATEENLAVLGTTSLNQKAIGPNTAKPGAASVLARRNRTPAYSILNKSGNKKTGSLIDRSGNTSISRPGMGMAGATSGRINIKPKF